MSGVIWGPRGKLGLLVLLGALAGAAPAQAALSNDGTVTVRYSGKLAQAYVANPSNPAYDRGTSR
jgi:hypothetical protein